MHTPHRALEALSEQPCGARLLEATAGAGGCWLVGGAVRDLLLGRTPRELDVVLEQDPAELAGRLGETIAAHERFGTRTVRHGDCVWDLARARAERYAHPGALPEVRPAGLEEDLLRRDFTANAIALGLGRSSGEVRAAPGALEALAGRRLCVLHDQSFLDDPTRLWRLVRYAVRLGFLPGERTDRLAREAVLAGAMASVAPQRVVRELRLALAEPDPLATLHAASALGIVPSLRIDPGLVRRALDLAPPGAREDLVLLGAVVGDLPWLRSLLLPAREQRILERCVLLAPIEPGRPSELHRRLEHEPAEAIAVAGARGDGQAAAEYLLRHRGVRLAITGEDLLAAGLPMGPDIGRALRAALDSRLDGELPDDREAQLRFALEEALRA